MLSRFKNAVSFGKKSKNNQATINNQATTSNKKPITNNNRFNKTHKRGKFLNRFTRRARMVGVVAVLTGEPISIGVVAISLVIIKIMKLSNNNSKLGRLMKDLTIIIIYINTNYVKDYVEKSSETNGFIIKIKTHLDNLFSLLNLIEIEINKEKKKYIMTKSKSFTVNPKEKILEIITEVSLLNSLLIIDLKTSIDKIKSSNNSNIRKNNSNKNVKNQTPIQGLVEIIEAAPLNVQKTALETIKTSEEFIDKTNGEVEPIEGIVNPANSVTNSPIVEGILNKIKNESPSPILNNGSLPKTNQTK